MTSTADLPKLALTRNQRIRAIVVGVLVVVALSRVVPDLIRLVTPQHYFAYTTDGDARVTTVGRATAAHALRSPWPGLAPWSGVAPWAGVAREEASPAKETAPVGHVRIGDRVRIDRIRPFDRKPGIVGRGYTYENVDRYLPVERYGREQVVHLRGTVESQRVQFLDVLRILLFVAGVALGAILFLVKPGITTAAFFVFCLAAVEAPATYFQTLIPYPWRPVPDAVGDLLRGFARPALLLFALCLIDGDRDAARERLFAWIMGALGLALGLTNAYAGWRLNYAGLPTQHIYDGLREVGTALMLMTAIAFAIAFLRARRRDRERVGWIVIAFLFAGAARLASDTLYPGHIPFWGNSILVSATIVPIVVVWVAVSRGFFNIDFVVSRAVVYAAISAGVLGTIAVAEEVGTYFFYQNADLAYLVFSAITLGIGIFTGKLAELGSKVVDRFIFRNRREQRQALEFIAGYILDAETVEDVYRALLQDASHALQLSFAGILGRQPDGGYVLAQSWNWPPDLKITLGAGDQLTRAITSGRGALAFQEKDTRLIQRTFQKEGLTFAAPLFFDRTVSGIVVYGHNVSGLDLDPEERELLVRVVAHASIALNTIELNRYRASSAPAPLPIGNG